jgi:hypothetical protein
MVDKSDYRAMLEKAVAELIEALARQEALDDEREDVAGRIAELQQGVIALGPLAGVHAQSKYAELLSDYALFMPTGLKESVFAVLGKVSDDRYLTPVAIRNALPDVGYEIKSKNILPSIHTVLKREMDRTVEVGDVNGKAGYRLIKKDRPSRNPLARLRFPTPDAPKSSNTILRRVPEKDLTPRQKRLAREAQTQEGLAAFHALIGDKDKK